MLVLPRDSQKMAPTLGGGTQDTDFNKGFAKGIFKIFLDFFCKISGSKTEALGFSRGSWRV